MEISGHCSFCEHKEFDFVSGNLCGLTKQKADFLQKCPKIVFGDTAKEEIAKINLEHNQLKDQKPKVIEHLVLFSIIGIVVIFAATCYTQVLYEEGWLLYLNIGIIGIAAGLSLIGNGFARYIKYTNANSVVKSQKQRMDSFFALYDYDYRINFEDENYQTAIILYRSKQKVR